MESIKTPKTKHTKIIKANIAQGDKPEGLDEKNPHHFCKSAGSLMRQMNLTSDLDTFSLLDYYELG